jgi:hypothetical protein
MNMAAGWGRVLLAGVVLMAGAAPLAGCTESERAVTVSAPSTAGSAPTSADSSGARAAGDVLTAAAAKAALPEVGELPTGWSTDPDQTVTKNKGDAGKETVQPQRCEVVFEGLRANAEIKESVRVAADFTAGGFGPFLGVTIKSFPEEFDTSTFADLTSGLSECPKFTTTKGKERTSFTASALSFPKLGDATYAVRFKATTDGITAGYDVVGIAIGHNLIQIGQVAVGGPADAKVMEAVARGVLERIGKT